MTSYYSIASIDEALNFINEISKNLENKRDLSEVSLSYKMYRFAGAYFVLFEKEIKNWLNYEFKILLSMNKNDRILLSKDNIENYLILLKEKSFFNFTVGINTNKIIFFL